MSRVLCVLLLTAASASYAAPSHKTDDMDALLADRGLLSHVEHVRQSIKSQTSEVVMSAMGFLGVPYRRGGNRAESGFDCSGFVRAIYGQTVGLLLPRRADEQAAATEKIDRKELKPGDLVFFKTMRSAFSHVGMYVGENKFIHAPKPGAEVRVEDMDIRYWKTRFTGARRVVQDTGAD